MPGCRPAVSQMIVPISINGSAIRDITRLLKVSINTVLKTIKQAAEDVAEPSPASRVTDMEIDEMWSFAGKKANQRWLWYGFDPARKQVICWQRGRRTDATCRDATSQRLLQKLGSWQVLRYCADDREWYQEMIAVEGHCIGKESTQDIERNNLSATI